MPTEMHYAYNKNRIRFDRIINRTHSESNASAAKKWLKEAESLSYLLIRDSENLHPNCRETFS